MNNNTKVHKDCFAYVEKKDIGRCTALLELYCEREDCKFYKKHKEEVRNN